MTFQLLVELLRRYSSKRELRSELHQILNLCRSGLRSTDAAPPRVPYKLDSRLTPEDRARITATYQAGSSMNQVMEQFKLGKHAVHKILHEAGVANGPRPRITPAQVDRATALYSSGLSCDQVGEQLGFSGTTIWRCLRDTGIATRDTHGRER